MRLYVMRHGPAEDRAPSGRDFDRVLTPEGRGVVLRAASALEGFVTGAPLARILTSPRARARETAILVRDKVARTVELELRDELGGEEAIPGGLVTGLARAGADTLLVGHQPVVEDLVRELLYPRSHTQKPSSKLALTSFRTATIVTLEATLEQAEAVRWALGPILDPHRA